MVEIARNSSENRPTDHALQQYAHAKQEVIAILRKARVFLDRAGNRSGCEQLDALLARLAEDRFHLVVLGQFKRGKSSLINAIIGKDLLPTASVPLTSAVTSLRYGPVERAIIRRRGWVLPQEVPISQLAAYITEPGNPGNEKGVLSVEVQVPAPFLRRNLFFIDTPGIGSIYAHNTATTYAFLPQADAAIFVTSVDGPLTEVELRFLDAIRHHVRKIFFVLNKVDQLSEAEREEVLTFSTQVLTTHLGVEDVRIFPLSARQALHAKLTHDPALLEASGLPAFEAALAGFLHSERCVVFLASLLDRALRIIQEEYAVLNVTASTHQRSMAERAAQLAAFRQQMELFEEELHTVRERLTRRAENAYEAIVGPLVDTFISEVVEILTAELSNQGAPEERGDAEEYYAQLLTWAQQRRNELAQAWLMEHADQFHHIARELTQTALPLLTEIIGRVMQAVKQLGDFAPCGEHHLGQTQTNSIANSRIGLAAPHADVSTTSILAPLTPITPTPEAEELLEHWSVPPFDFTGVLNTLQLQDATRYDAAPFAPLPRVLARRVMRRAVQQRFAALAAEAGATVREHVRNYLRWCVSDLCRVAQQAIEMRRQRLEQALQGSMNQRASSPDHGYQAASSDDLAQRRDELTQLMEQLTTLRDMLLQHGHLPDEGTTGKQPLEDSDGNINAALPKHLPDVSLITDLQDHAITASADRAVEETSTCPLCAAVLDAVIRFLSHLQYALATDPATQHEFLAAHGLCIHHTWQLEALSSPHGLCSSYPPLLERIAKLLLEFAELPIPSASERMQELLPGVETCAACRVRQQTEQVAAERLAARLATPAGWAAFTRSKGLCIAHLRLIITLLDDHLAAQLLRHHADSLTHIAEAMHGYVLKCDARRRELLTPDEDEAYRRALVLLVGERQVY
jgi:GTP-binding protein EngB required for normal cell division